MLSAFKYKQFNNFTKKSCCYENYSNLTSNLKDFLQKESDRIDEWWGGERFKDIKRDYSAINVVKHRGTIPVDPDRYISSLQARKLFNALNTKLNDHKPLHTIGVMDPVQMTQLSRCSNIEAIYISGWACSSTFVGSTNEVSPDFGDYPYDTVPRQVERIFKAQQLHDRKQFLSKLNGSGSDVDYLKPIIADADMGHGGITTVMKLAKLFAEKGAAAIHLEDQLVGGKKCGHLGGTVLVPTCTHLSRLIATRFQWDIMGTENLLIARTDSLNSKLISSNCDPRDHEFIKGTINSDCDSWIEKLMSMEREGASQNVINEAEEEWFSKNKVYTFDEFIRKELDGNTYKDFQKMKLKFKTLHNRDYLSLNEMIKLIYKIKPTIKITFNWENCKTREGYYMYNNCAEAAVRRSKIFAPYSELVWLETKTPNINEAKYFSKEITKLYPEKKLVYNLSPSFNWLDQGFSPRELKNFIWDLSAENFVLQIVSLGGVHVNAVSFWELINKFAENGMESYVNLVQEKEKQLNCDVLKHQIWSGIELIDSMVNVIQNGSSVHTSSTRGDSFTEKQFE